MKSQKLLYASGNSLNIIDVDTTRDLIGDTPESKGTQAFKIDMHSKLLVGDAPINEYAVLERENIIAYSERYSHIVRIVKWSPGSQVVSMLHSLTGSDD